MGQKSTKQEAQQHETYKIVKDAFYALKRALWNRKRLKGLMVHTDQGSQFISNNYRILLNAWDLKQSMSRRGNCWDNAVIESFFKTLKTEVIYQFKYLMEAGHIKRIVSEYIGYDNHDRPHSTNDYLSPIEFEQLLKTI